MCARHILAIFLLAATIAPAATFTPLFVSGEPALAVTLDAVYGVDGYTRVSDDLDQLWAGNAVLSVIAISSYADATQTLGLLTYNTGFIFFQTSRAAALGILLTLMVVPIYFLWRRVGRSP